MTALEIAGAGEPSPRMTLPDLFRRIAATLPAGETLVISADTPINVSIRTDTDPLQAAFDAFDTAFGVTPEGEPDAGQ